MIKHLMPLLRRLVGGIRKNMATIQITVAMALIPSSIGVFIWGIDKNQIGIILFAIVLLALGMIAWYASLVDTRKEQAAIQKERSALLKVLRSIDRETKLMRKGMKNGGK